MYWIKILIFAKVSSILDKVVNEQTKQTDENLRFSKIYKKLKFLVNRKNFFIVIIALIFKILTNEAKGKKYFGYRPRK